jgi:hypothetical protein
MKRKVVLISIMFLFLVIANSCTKVGPEGPEGPSGPAGSALSGSLVGFVTLYDEFGVAVADKSGVTVTVDGYLPALTATTNSAGKYQIDNLQAGTYDLVFTKTGYATYKSLGFSFVGGVKPRLFYATLAQQSNTLLTNLVGSIFSTTTMTLSCTVAPAIPAGYYRIIRFYFGKTNTVSSTNYITTSATSSSTTSYSANRSFDKMNYPTGTTLYVIAYGESNYTYGYPDLTTGLTIYTTINSTPSNIVSIVVP